MATKRTNSTAVKYVLSLAVIAFALGLGIGIGGVTVRVFSDNNTVEAENTGDSPQIIVNGRNNDAVVTLAPLPVVEPRNGGGYVIWLAVFMAAALYSGWRVIRV